jgi:hypothetical protein
MKKSSRKKKPRIQMRRNLRHAISHIYFRIFLVFMSLIFASLVIAVVSIFSFQFQDVMRGAAPENNSSEIFEDVSSWHPNARAIYALKKKGIISGYADSKFRPDDKITRAELVALIEKSKGASPHGLLNSYCFKDVQKQWYANYVCHAKNKGWVSGKGDGTFGPDEYVNRAAAYKLLLGAFNVDVDTEDVGDVAKIYNDVGGEDWFAPHVYSAFQKGWVEKNADNNFYPYEELNRGQVAELLFKVISSEMPLF